MKYRTLLALLLALACLLTATSCANLSEGFDETTDATLAGGLSLDATSRIVISAEADAMTTKAAELVTATLKEQTGWELPIVSDAEASTGCEIVLGRNNRVDLAADEGAYRLSILDGSLYIVASDSTTLYFAVEAVLDAWTASEENKPCKGSATMTAAFAETLNGLSLRSDNTIRVLTQNMRYSNDPDGNSTTQRAPRYKQLLEEYQPDLIGTQEYTLTWDVLTLRIMNQGLEEGTLPEYGMVGCSREGRDTKVGEFNKIFYRLDRFELLDSDTTWLSYTPDQPSMVPNSLCNRICTWALLKDKKTGETILFANTHLDHGTDEVREAQMNILLDYLSERIGEYPFYLTGDFNTERGTDAHNAASEVLLDAHQTTMHDASVENRTYHAYTEDYGSEIDFIFHNDRVTPIYYEIVSKSYGGFVADHYGVFAEFVPNN